MRVGFAPQRIDEFGELLRLRNNEPAYFVNLFVRSVAELHGFFNGVHTASLYALRHPRGQRILSLEVGAQSRRSALQCLP